MPESIYQIPGNLSSESESVDVLKNPEVRDNKIDLARAAAYGNYSVEYVPTPETREQDRIIELVSRLLASHRQSVASDVQRQLTKKDYDIAA